MGFIEACQDGNLEEIKHLLSLTGTDRINIHAYNEEAFCWACSNGRLEIVKVLLSLTGDRYIDVHAYNERVFRLACSNGQLKVVKLLLSLTEDRYINVHAYNECAFRHACFYGQLKVVKLLLSLTGDRYIQAPIECITNETIATLVLQRFREQHRKQKHFLESCHNSIMYLRVKEELLHIPTGEIHSSFPGGLKFHETIERLVK
jgi:hypothetical protein